MRWAADTADHGWWTEKMKNERRFHPLIFLFSRVFSKNRRLKTQFFFLEFNAFEI